MSADGGGLAVQREESLSFTTISPVSRTALHQCLLNEWTNEWNQWITKWIIIACTFLVEKWWHSFHIWGQLKLRELRRPAHGCTAWSRAGGQGQGCPIWHPFCAQLGFLRRWWLSHLQTHQQSCNINPSGPQTRHFLLDGLFLPPWLITVSPGVQHFVTDPRVAIQFSLLGQGVLMKDFQFLWEVTFCLTSWSLHVWISPKGDTPSLTTLFHLCSNSSSFRM